MAFEHARLVDLDAQAILRESIGNDAFVDLIGLYLADSPNQIASLVAAYADGDHKVVWLAAHNLKSSSGAVGARMLKELCGRLELGSSDGKVLECELVDELTSLYEATKRALQQIVVLAREATE